MDNNTQPDTFDLLKEFLPSTNEKEAGTSEANDAVLQVLQKQMLGLVDTNEWKGLPAELRCKLLEAHVKSSNESVAKPLQPEGLNGSEQRPNLLTLTISKKRYYAGIGGLLHLHNGRFRYIYLFNTSNERVVYQIMPSQVDHCQRSTNWNGFLMPNERIAIPIWFNKKNVNNFIFRYKPSTQSDISNCFKSEKPFRHFTMAL